MVCLVLTYLSKIAGLQDSWIPKHEMSNFSMGTILGKGFAQAQVPKAQVL